MGGKQIIDNMKNLIKVMAVALALFIGSVFLISFQPKRSKEVLVKIIEAKRGVTSDIQAKAYILEMTKNGYTLKQIEAYVCGSTTSNCFLIVMER